MQIKPITIRPAKVEPTLARREDGTFLFVADGVEIEWPLATSCARFQVTPDHYGFEITDTGGGCTAWQRHFTYANRRVYMLLTNGDSGHEMSDDDSQIVIGVYDDGDCLCTWDVSQGESDYPRSNIERQKTTSAKTLRDVLSAGWCAFFMSEGQAGLLDWEADSHCGTEVQRIVRLADFTGASWPDQVDAVRRVAMRQICIICWG